MDQGLTAIRLLAEASRVSSVWPHTKNEGGGHPMHQDNERWAQCEKLSADVHRLCDIYTKLPEDEQVLCTNTGFIDLINEVARYHFEKMNTTEGLSLLEITFHLCGQAVTDIRGCLADTHNVMQSIYSRTNDLEKCYEHATAQFAIREELAVQSGTTETHAMAVSCSEHAKASLNLHRVPEARELFQRSKDIRERIPEFVPSANFNAVLGLGCVRFLEGAYDDAAKFFEEVLHDREELIGPNDNKGPRTGHALYWLGKARPGQGKFGEAFPLFLRAKAHFERTIGKDHFSAAPTYYKLACHYIRLEEFDQATLLLNHAMSIYSGDGNWDPHLARCCFKAGELLRGEGDTKGAHNEFVSAAHMRREICPGDTRRAKDLSEGDYDALIDSWAR